MHPVDRFASEGWFSCNQVPGVLPGVFRVFGKKHAAVK